jgi:glycosyltransferase AglD
MISLLIPAYNEEVHIYGNTEKIIKIMSALKESYEVLIVEESRDRTPEISEQLARKYKVVRHFHFDRRLGKGGAIEFGIKHARGDKIIFMDIDLATDLSALPGLIENLNGNDIVVGSRYHPKSRISRTPFRIFLGRTYAAVLRVLFLFNMRDYQCGFKGMKKSVGMKIAGYTRNKGLFWDTEFLFIAHKFGYRIMEIPVRWEEKKGRSAKISMKLIFSFVTALTKLFFRGLLGEVV